MMSSAAAVIPRKASKEGNEEKIMTKQTLHMKPQTHKERRTSTKEPHWNGQ